MCFSPQPRAYFQHQNLQKWSKHVSFLTFSLPNVLFATAACNFWCILSAPTSAPAALTGLLFDWPDTRIYEKTQHFVTSLTFSADVASFFLLSRYCMFFLLTSFCWLDYSTPLFNFPYCRKFLFKLPSIRLLGLQPFILGNGWVGPYNHVCAAEHLSNPLLFDIFWYVLRVQGALFIFCIVVM